MLDIKMIRENPEKVNELLKRRNPELSIDEVLEIDVERRKIQTQVDELRAKRKNDSQKIGLMKKNGENTDAVQEEVRKLGDDIKALEEKQTELDNKQRDILLHIPNIPDETAQCPKWHPPCRGENSVAVSGCSCPPGLAYIRSVNTRILSFFVPGLP